VPRLHPALDLVQVVAAALVTMPERGPRDPMSAREEILTRVREAVGPRSAARQEIARTYRTHTDDDLASFLGRLEHYEAKASRVHVDRLGDAVRGALAERGARRVVVPAGVPDDWVAGVEPLRDTPPLDAHALDSSDGLVSTCAVAIAATGTIVLDGSEGMGRRVLSLLPDYHLCVVRSEQVVSSLPEALAQLNPRRALTFISGPSATVDIELVRVGGVHGPRTLEVIIAEP
jgi:L-lactate dehydrogenase complex protein LldG